MYVFDDKKSIWHFMLGLVSAYFKALSIIIIFCYIIYQLREREKPESKLGDFIEFLLGYAYGLAVFS